MAHKEKNMIYELSKCFKSDDGRIICWDCVVKAFVEVSMKHIEPHQVPNDILKAFAEEAVKQENK